MSDREQSELRGPVAICVQEQDCNAAGKFLTTTEYSLEGKHLTSHSIHPNGSECVSTFTYDGDGRLTKITGGPPNEPGTESLFTYATRRDEQNRKTVTKGFDSETLRQAQGCMVSGSLWDAAVYAGVGIPVGGTLTLIYNREDQPIEAQMFDGEGQIVNRLTRTYDANGRILEEKQIRVSEFVDCETERQPNFKSPEEEVMHRAMAMTLSGELPSEISYTRDTQGRVIEKREGSFAFAKVTTTRYNEQGYKAEEQITFAGKSVSPTAELPISTAFRVHSDIHYAYEYDSNGNWTEQTRIDRTRLNDPSIVFRRRITYY